MGLKMNVILLQVYVVGFKLRGNLVVDFSNEKNMQMGIPSLKSQWIEIVFLRSGL